MDSLREGTTQVNPESQAVAGHRAGGVDSAYAWARLSLAVLLSTIGGVGMWSVVVVLPAVQAEFNAARGEASLPYTLAMLGFAFGGIAMGRMADKVGIALPVAISGAALGVGYVATGFSTQLWQFAVIYGLIIGVGSAATFGPLMADTSHWFVRRRGIAVAICASGNYISGTIWPPVVRYLVDTVGWRDTQIGIGVFCAATIIPLALMLRRPSPMHAMAVGSAPAAIGRGTMGLKPATLQWLLAGAGLACCMAMSMPQVHIVAYCGDLGYGVARGAEMLSLMLGFGIISRVASGFIADRIGGLRTLLLGSALQGVALVLYLGFDGLTSLYIISAMFGLFQGGIVPSYAIIVREYFPPAEAGARVGVALMSTLFGMALGGWLSGVIFDVTLSYQAAFLNGVAWNLVNLSIVGWLLWRLRGRPQGAVAAA